jgi:hypothetical protein
LLELVFSAGRQDDHAFANSQPIRIIRQTIWELLLSRAPHVTGEAKDLSRRCAPAPGYITRGR